MRSSSSTLIFKSNLFSKQEVRIIATFTIRTLADQFDLELSTLRYYEEIGLLPNVTHCGNRRIYDESHVERLRAIECFKTTGMTIKEIQQFFKYDQGELELDPIIALLARHVESTEQQVASLIQNLENIKRKLAFYQAIKTAREQQQPDPLWSDYLQRHF